MTDTKITFIGAGSGNFAMNVVKDICLTAGLHGSTVTLMDLDENRLDAVYTLARWYSEGKKAGIRFEKTLDRKGALDGADFVIDTALAGGHDQQEATRAVGERHGYYRGPEAAEFNMVADYSTTFQGYYQLKLFMDLARDMEEVCPDAWLIDVANPECEATTLLTRETKIKKVVGYCHGFLHYANIADTLGLEPSQVDYQVAGFNHNIFLTRFRYNERDAYPLIDEWMKNKAEQYWTTRIPTDEFDVYMSRASFDMYELYGLFPVGDTPRSGSWKYHYDLKTKQYWYGIFGGPDSEVGWARYLNRVEKDTQKFLRVSKSVSSSTVFEEFPPVKSKERIVPFIDSVVNDMGERIVLNVRNDGTIQGLPDDVAVEVPVRVRRNGVERERIDKIPKSLLSMALVPRMVKLEMALEAFLTGDRSILLEILYRDPRTKSNKQAEETLEEILDLPFNREMKKHYS